MKSRFSELPTTAVIQAGKTKALGEIAVFDYSGTEHYAVVESIGMGTFHVSESHFGKNAISERDVSFADPHLRGFYSIVHK